MSIFDILNTTAKTIAETAAKAQQTVQSKTTSSPKTTTALSSSGATAIQPTTTQSNSQKTTEIFKSSSGTSSGNSIIDMLKNPGKVVIGKDVIGTPVTIKEIAEESKNAPNQGVMTDAGKYDWAKNQITTSGIHNTNIQTTEAKSQWGVSPDQSNYDPLQSKLRQDIESGKSELQSELAFKNQFETSKSAYESNKSALLGNISQIKSSATESQWWLDINQNKIQEPNEIFLRDVALQKTQDVFNANEKNWSGYQTSYQNVSANIPKLRAGLVSQINLQSTVGAYKEAGYKLNVSDTGLSFSPMTAKETYDIVHPGIGGRALFLAKQWGTFGIPETVAVLTGKKTEYEEGEYARILQMQKQPGETNIDYSKRFWTSPEAITQVYLPLATLGAGAVMQGLAVGGEAVGSGFLTSKLTALGGTTTGRLTNVAIKSGMTTIGVFGGVTAGTTIASTAIYNPSQLSMVTGQVLGQTAPSTAGFLAGSSLVSSRVSAPLLDAQGRANVRVKIFSEDVQVMRTIEQQGNLGKIKGWAEVFVQGEKPGTGIRYRYNLEAMGQGGKTIGENLQVSRAYGIFKKPSGAKIAEFETYGKNTIPAKIGNTDIYLVAEKSISGVYSKTMKPGVFETKGYSLLKNVGTREISVGNEIVSKVGQFDITARASVGVFKSAKVKGTYTEIDESALFKGFKKGGVIIKQGEISNLDTFLMDTRGTARLTLLNEYRTNLISQVATKSVTNVNPVLSTQMGVGLGFASPIAKYVSFSTSISIPKSVVIPINMQKLGLTTVSSQKTVQSQKLSFDNAFKQVQVQKTSQNLSFDTSFKQIQVQKLVFDTGNKSIQVNRTIPSLTYDVVSKTMQVQRTGVLQIQKQESLQIQKSSQLQLIKLVTFTPTITTTTTIPILPVLPFGGTGGAGGSYGGLVFEADWKHRKKIHPTKLLFKEIIVPKIYLKNW